MRALLAGFLIVATWLPLPAKDLPEGFAAPKLITIPAGEFVFGSTPEEREAAYRLDEKEYGHSNTRRWGWYDKEHKRQKRSLPAFDITQNLITNAQYEVFVKATGHRIPRVEKKVWDGYKLIHPYRRAIRHFWRSKNAPRKRRDHPVVLVSQSDVRAYAAWLSSVTGRKWRLPSEEEWEKAARGTDGRRFPWGERYNQSLLNSHDAGPFDTMPVGSFPKGASPYGLNDPAGQVFEWTATRKGKGRHIVKGGSWDDKGCGICRPAARHSRPDAIKHILVGFRLIRE